MSYTMPHFNIKEILRNLNPFLAREKLKKNQERYEELIGRILDRNDFTDLTNIIKKDLHRTKSFSNKESQEVLESIIKILGDLRKLTTNFGEVVSDLRRTLDNNTEHLNYAINPTKQESTFSEILEISYGPANTCNYFREVDTHQQQFGVLLDKIKELSITLKRTIIEHFGQRASDEEIKAFDKSLENFLNDQFPVSYGIYFDKNGRRNI